MNTYPRIGGKSPKATRPHFKKQTKCRMCREEGADTVVDIQYSEFRGDDESYLVHYRCFFKIRINEDDMTVIRWLEGSKP